MLTVLDPGALTTVQDAGRSGWARFGVPPSGPMDRVAFDAANALVGNPAGTAALEITLTGPTLHVWQETLIAVCGADFEIWSGRLPVPAWHAVYVRAGTRLRFGQRLSGVRAIMAIAGGIAVPPYLGSRSTYLSGGFGGYGGRALRQGNELRIGPTARRELFARAGRAWPMQARPRYASDPVVRVVLGPQDDHFAPAAVAAYLSATYTVTPASDRMGIRTVGPPLVHTGASGIVSDGLVTGCVQVPPDGQPIVMMVDHQTTGGYPKIATVIQADLPLLAQLLPGDTIRFKAVTLAEARHAASRAIAVGGLETDRVGLSRLGCVSRPV